MREFHTGYTVKVVRPCKDLAGVPIKYGQLLHILSVGQKVITIPREKLNSKKQWLHMKPLSGYYEFNPEQLSKVID